MSPRLIVLLLVSAFASPLLRAHEEEEHAEAVSPSDPTWFNGAGVTVLDGLLTPSLHAIGAFGGSTADPAELAVGHHDPSGDATLQALEAGLALEAGRLRGFAVYTAYTGQDRHLDGFLEEGYLRLVDLPWGLELRGGQFLNRFGFQNGLHNHDWLFVDQNLVNGRFLNEGELATLGGEVTWNLPGRLPAALSLAVGGLPQHRHDHEHGEEGEEPEFDAAGANFDSWIASSQLAARYERDEFHRLTGILSGAWGENEFGKLTQIYGLGFESLWREHGHEPGGRYLRWRSEAMLRAFDAVSGHGHHEEEEGHDHDTGEPEEEEGGRAAGFEEFGFYSLLAYGWSDHLETSFRGEWVSGIDEAGLDERWRLSPAATWFLGPRRLSHLRLQYNFDVSDSFGEEHSVWAQLQFSWGGD